MFRAIIELLITILVVIVARAILKSFLRASANALRTGSAQGKAHRNSQPPSDFSACASTGGELHKDPVCGTYVAESTPFRQHISGQTFFYCSQACREKHALVAR